MSIDVEKDDLKEIKKSNAWENAESRGLTWESLNNIRNDYKANYFDTYKEVLKEIISLLEKEKPKEIKTMHGRVKDPNHLAKKIVRKIGDDNSSKYRKIDVNNYRDILTDLIGIRILLLKREDWNAVDRHIRKIFGNYIEESKAHVFYGDRYVFNRNIELECTTKGYRSVHYIVLYKGIHIEIQIRTLAEEVYGEFDHEIRYPYRVTNNFLTQYSHIISKAVSELDDLISMLFIFPDSEINRLSKVFNEDKYCDLKTDNKEVKLDDQTYNDNTEAETIIRNKIFTRKG